MLSAAAMRSRSKRQEQEPERQRPITRARSERVAHLINTSRSKLEPLANAQSFASALKIHQQLGDLDGVGLLLKMASFDAASDGTISEEELRRFEHEGTQIVDALNSSLLNFSVLFSLFLTIFVSLQVLHVGREPYEQAAPTLKLAASPYTAAAGDAATFLSNDPEAFRWVCYVLEWLLLSIGTLVQTIGLCMTMGRYMTTVNLPSVVAKCEFLLSRPKGSATIVISFLVGPMILLLGVLPMMLVRASAVAFLSACASGLLFLVFFIRATIANDEVKAQLAEVRVVLAGG